MEFVVTGLTGSYSLYSFLNLKINRDNLKDEKWKENKKFLHICENKDVKAISLNIYENKVDFPIYIGVGKNGSVGIPIGGSNYEECKEIYNKFSTNEFKLENWEYLDSYNKEYFINTPDSLRDCLNNNDIDETSLLIKLPIKVKHTKLSNIYYTKFTTPLLLRENYLVSSNLNNLIKVATFRKRMPFSITSGIISLIGISYIYNNTKYIPRKY